MTDWTTSEHWLNIAARTGWTPPLIRARIAQCDHCDGTGTQICYADSIGYWQRVCGYCKGTGKRRKV